MRKWKLLITPREACELMHTVPDPLRQSIEPHLTHGRVPDPGELDRLLQGQDGVVLDLESVTEGLLSRCQQLKVISRFGEGCDAIDLVAAKQRGVRVARTRGVAAVAVARHALALTLALTHRLIENDAALKRGEWIRQANVSDDDMTLGIAGYGSIGRQMAQWASTIGFRVMIWNHRKIESPYPCAESFEALCRQADIVSLHLALTDATRRIVSADALAALSGKFVINTARGGLVDESALLRALERGVLRGYATDVFATEPVTDISRAIASHPRVIGSPHIAALDHGTAVGMTGRAVANAVYCLDAQHERVASYVV